MNKEIEEQEEEKTVDFGDEVVEEEEVEEEVVEEDEEEDEEEETEDEEKKPSIQIPKHRFDEVNTERKNAVKRVEELEARLTDKQNVDLLNTYKQEKQTIHAKYQDALVDGDKELASALYAQMDEIDDRIIDFKADQISNSATQTAVNNMKYDTLLDKMEDEHPEINFGGDDYDPEKAKEVSELLKGFTSQGYSSSVSLQRAIDYAFPSGDKEKEMSPLRNKRNEETRKKNAKTQYKLSPDLDKLGENSDKLGDTKGAPDIMSMSEEEYDKLSEQQKAIIRGDMV